MRKASLLALVCAAILASESHVEAQVPYIQAYYDEELSNNWDWCMDDQFRLLHFVLQGFNNWVIAVEFRVYYPPSVLWLGDNPPTPLRIGHSPSGISIAWNYPQNAFDPLVILEVPIYYVCSKCTDRSATDSEQWIRIDPHPVTGLRAAVRWPELEVVALDWKPTVVSCTGTVPTHETTWGSVKALYGYGD